MLQQLAPHQGCLLLEVDQMLPQLPLKFQQSVDTFLLTNKKINGWQLQLFAINDTMNSLPQDQAS